MKQVYVDESAGRVLDALYADEPATARKIDEMLDVLEHNHGDRRVRTRSFSATAARTGGIRGPLWGFDVRGRDRDYVVLWEPGEDANDVRYIGDDLPN